MCVRGRARVPMRAQMHVYVCAGTYAHVHGRVHVCTRVCVSVRAARQRSRLKHQVTWELLLDGPYLGFGFL